MNVKKVLPIGVIIVGAVAAFGLHNYTTKLNEATYKMQLLTQEDGIKLKSYQQLNKVFGYQGNNNFETSNPVYVVSAGKEPVKIAHSNVSAAYYPQNSSNKTVSCSWNGNQENGWDLNVTGKHAGATIITVRQKVEKDVYKDAFKVLVLVKE